jgi:hypothetical protein
LKTFTFANRLAITDRSAGEVDVPIATFDHAALTKLHAYLVFTQAPAPGISETGQVAGAAYLTIPADLTYVPETSWKTVFYRRVCNP